MGKKKTEQRMLPAIKAGCQQDVIVFDAFIDEVYVSTPINSWRKDVDVIQILFTYLQKGDEQITDDGDVITDGEWYYQFNIEVDVMENSLYYQLLTAAFHDEELPNDAFNPNELKDKFVQLVIRDERFLMEIRPFPGDSKRIRELYMS